MKVSLIMPVHNSASTLAMALDAIVKLDPPADEVIIIDDSSDDSSGEIANDYRFRSIHFNERRGAASARNCGAAMASGDLLFFVDSDVVLPPDAVGKVKGAFEKSDSIGAVSGLYSTQINYQNWPSCYQNLFYPYYQSKARTGEGDLTTSCGAIRAELFRRAGGFDEKILGATAEDKQLGYALQNLGAQVHVLRDLEVEHPSCYSWRGFIKREFRLMKALAKSFIRTGNVRRKAAQRNYLPVLLSIPIAVLVLTSLLWFILSPGVFPSTVLFILAMSFVILNGPFLGYVWKIKGWKWAFGALVAGFIDMLIVASALIWAVLDYYLWRNRY